MADTVHTVEWWPPSDLLRRLIQFGQSLGFDFPENFGTAECPSAVVESPKSHIAIRFDVRVETKRLDILAWVKTTSWDYEGERTDIHDTNALSFALQVWEKMGLSSNFLYDPGYCSKSEMSCVMLTFPQPHPPGLSLDEDGVQRACALLALACQCWDTFAVCTHPAHINGQGHLDDTGYSYDAAGPWAKAILGGLRRGDTKASVNYSRRLCPDWSYFFMYRSGVAVLRAPRFVESWCGLIPGRCPNIVEGVRGRLVLDGESRHFVSYGVMERAARVLRALGETARGKELPCVVFDNRVLFFGTGHIVALFRECGRAAFEIERDRVRGRYQVESDLLFPPTRFSWTAAVPDGAFEAMICELLGLEPNVVRVRRAGVTRERDGGRISRRLGRAPYGHECSLSNAASTTCAYRSSMQGKQRIGGQGKGARHPRHRRVSRCGGVLPRSFLGDKRCAHHSPGPTTPTPRLAYRLVDPPGDRTTVTPTSRCAGALSGNRAA